MTDDANPSFEAAIFGLPNLDPAHAAQGRELLEVLASEFIDAVRRGENPSVADCSARHPELAAQIEELFPMLAAMEGWKAYRAHTSLEHRAISVLTSERFGSFRIIREIGRGSMGIVFEAEEAVHRERVAIKVLPYLTSRPMRDRFEREARTAARLAHPHIVPVSGFGEVDGLCYYVMRLVRGVGLDWIIQELSGRRGTISPDDISAQFQALPRAVDAVPPDAAPRGISAGAASHAFGRDSWTELARIGLQLADALMYAHSRGTLHRDIKPANVLVDQSLCAWLTDFGLAKNIGEMMDTSRTGPAGTLRYIAPEQFSGRIDARSDLYSLGVTLFELLTRSVPYESDDRDRLAHLIAHSSLPRPRAQNAWIPRDLDAIVAKATAHDPAQRYQSAADLRDDLNRFVGGRRVHARGIFGWLSILK